VSIAGNVPALNLVTNQAQFGVGRVRFCANKSLACVRYSTLLPNIRLQNTRRFTSAPPINPFEGLAVARSWGFESPLPHQ